MGSTMRREGWQFRKGLRLVAVTALLGACIARGQAQAKPADTAKGPSAADRQKAMQADMDRLLQLARQLKAEVDRSRKDELSVKVIHDADEIDKLARSARGRIGH